MGGSIPAIKPKKLLSILQKKGFFIHHQKGSHAVLKHFKIQDVRVTLPIHDKDLKRKTLLSILKQAKLTVDDISKK